MNIAKTTLIFADDQTWYRKAVVHALSEYNISTVAQVSNGLQLIQVLESGLRADVLLLDLRMPEFDGNWAFIQIKDRFPDFRTAIFSQYDDPVLTEHYRRRGASAFVSKERMTDGFRTLADIINKVNSEGGFHTVNDLQTNKEFSPEEESIAVLIIQGKSSKMISVETGLSIKRVNKIRYRLYHKFGVKSTHEFIRHGLDKGFQFMSKECSTK